MKVIIRSDAKGKAITAFFPEKKCEVGFIYGYSFHEMHEKLYSMVEYNNTYVEHTPGLVSSLLESIYGKVEIHFRDKPEFRKVRWGV